MTYPTTSNRTQVKRALVDRLIPKATEIEECRALYGFPLNGEYGQRDICVLGAEGAQEPGSKTEGRARRRDKFRLHVWMGDQTPGYDTPEIAENAAMALLALLENVIAEDRTLGGNVHSAFIEQVDGPLATPGASEGWISFINAYVMCDAELR